jgi:ubiquinone/menaquinone biosynthesis C-methylase UbiE
MIDYNVASKSYDNTRRASDKLIDLFARSICFSRETTVLDFGCGTGNYLRLLGDHFGCRCYGVEPSDGMRARASERNPDAIIEPGDHSQIPFPAAFFDFIYMTDVVHHVPDLDAMFRTLLGALKPEGRLCIVTESHAQIEGRFYNRYFPSMAGNEKRRYPDTPEIVRRAVATGFRQSSLQTIPGSPTDVVSDSLIRTVEEKNYSMFRLLGNDEYAAGLERIRADRGTGHANQGAGTTLIWLEPASRDSASLSATP